MSPRVAILLGTKNGASYLPHQLESYIHQSHKNWRLYVSDDGSSDDTLDILQQYRKSVSQPVEIIVGPQRGFAANYLSLLKNDSVHGDYFAFSDQDDVWYFDKLERAVAWLATVPDEVPALYFSRTDIIGASGNSLGCSTLWTRPPSFKNALVQNIGGANTMVFNRAAKRFIAAVDGEIVSHDWTAYQLVTAVGGKTWFDARPTLAYRQHESNMMGSNLALLARLHRIRLLFAGQFAQWTEANLATLRPFRAQMTLENRETYDLFSRARSGPLLSRIYNLLKSGVYRQKPEDALALLIATIFKRY